MESDPIQKEPNHKRPVILAVIFVGVMLIIGAPIYKKWHNSEPRVTSGYPGDATQVFAAMLQNTQMTAFETEQHITTDSKGKQLLKVVSTLDLTDMAHVRSYSTYESEKIEKLGGKAIKSEVITTPEGVFARYDKLGDAKIWQGWFTLYNNDQPDPNADGLFLFGSESGLSQLFFGYYIPGVYNHETRKKAYEFYRAESMHNPYQFFSENVHRVSDSGKTYYTYDLDIKQYSSNLAALNKAVADSLGTKLSDSLINSLQVKILSLSFWINPSTKRLERAVIKLPSGLTETVYYYDYNVISDIQMPPKQPAVTAKKLLMPAIKALQDGL